MRILALETSTEWCSVAVGDGARWHRATSTPGSALRARAGAGGRAVLAEAGWTLRGLDGIAFGAGPGSFTGVRIACGLAQGLALGADRPLVPVPTLDRAGAVAADGERSTRIVACLDARMREVYVAAYARAASGRDEVAAPAVLAPAAARRAPAATAGSAPATALARIPISRRTSDWRRSTPRRGRRRRAVGELALPRLAAGEGVRGRRRAAALRPPPRRADDRRARGRRAAL